MADPNCRIDEAILQQAAALLAELEQRPRTVLETPNINHAPNHNAHDNERAGRSHAVVRDTGSINALYELYLHNTPISYDTEVGSTSKFDDLVEINDLRILELVCFKPVAQRQSSGVRVVPETALPPDASATLLVEGLPANCTRREVSHLFRPFHGYKEVRVVMKEPQCPGGDPVVLCFVDFESPAHAATAKDALQGYVFDDHERDSCHLRFHYYHTPGARTGFTNLGRQ